MRLRDRFMRFMSGRYGSDNLSRFILVVALIMVIVNMILGRVFPESENVALLLIETILTYGSLIILVWGIFRTFSRNVTKRYNENNKYLRAKAKVKGFFSGQTRKTATKNGTYKVFKCPACKQKVRVPKGKGRIAITCPKCKTQFIKKS